MERYAIVAWKAAHSVGVSGRCASGCASGYASGVSKWREQVGGWLGLVELDWVWSNLVELG